MPNINAILRLGREKPRFVSLSTAVSGNDRPNYRLQKVAMGDLAEVAGNNIVFAWENPESTIIIVTEVVIWVSVIASAASTLNVDVVNDATSNGNTILLNFALNATGLMGSHEVGGGGNERPHVMNANGEATNTWVTGYESANAVTTNIVGRYYIYYTEVP